MTYLIASDCWNLPSFYFSSVIRTGKLVFAINYYFSELGQQPRFDLDICQTENDGVPFFSTTISLKF